MNHFTARAAAVFLLSVLSFSSCKKKVDRELEREAARWEGRWTVARIRCTVTDTLGTTLRDSSLAAQGTMEFRRAGNKDADVFDPVLFHGACAGSELVSYFRAKAAGGPTTDGWSLYWEADPEAERLMVWGTGPLSSYHRTVNLEYTGKGSDARTISYVYSPAGAPGQLVFVHWELEK